MQWLLVNWFWFLIGIAFFAMHIFGHGSHGAHDAHGRDRRPSEMNDPNTGENPQLDDNQRARDHHH